jgi:hypothetical protein
MKLTLLEMVQDILSDMDSDEVNSINDTVEALQVAQIVKTSYLEMVDNRNWAHQEELLQLESYNNNAYPNYLVVPSKVTELNWIRYNKRRTEDTKDKHERIIYKDPVAFMDTVNARDSSQSNIVVITDPYSNISLNIRNDMPPQYYTSFNDIDLVFDSWDSTLESTLQGSRTQAHASLDTQWTMEDAFIPDLPSNAFSALLHEAKSTAFITLKALANDKAEQKASRQHRWLSRNERLINGGVKYPDYGRKSKKTSSRLFDKDSTNAGIVPEPEI